MHTKQTNGRGQSQKTHIKQENNEFNLREREREREREKEREEVIYIQSE